MTCRGCIQRSWELGFDFVSLKVFVWCKRLGCRAWFSRTSLKKIRVKDLRPVHM